MTEQELLLDCVRRLNVSVFLQRGNLDEIYLRRWASELGLAVELEDALSGKFKPKQT